VLAADNVDPREAVPQDLDRSAVRSRRSAIDEYAIVARWSDGTNGLHEISTGHSSKLTAIKKSGCDDDAYAVWNDEVGGFKGPTDPDSRTDLVHLLRIGTNDASRRRRNLDAIIYELQDEAHRDGIHWESKYIEALHLFDLRLEKTRSFKAVKLHFLDIAMISEVGSR
jgi:hypothetical protein